MKIQDKSSWKINDLPVEDGWMEDGTTPGPQGGGWAELCARAQTRRRVQGRSDEPLALLASLV